MITIDRKGDITMLNAAVTDFAGTMGYCEYKIPLSIQGVKPRPSRAVILGTRAHKEEEEYEEQHAELVPVTEEQLRDEEMDIEFAREDVHSTLSIPFEFGSENVLVTLSGRIDKILREGSTLIVQDDKFVGKPQIYDAKDKPYSNQLLQVLAYLNSTYTMGGKDPEDAFDLPHSRKRWRIRICDSKTKEPYKTFSEYQDQESHAYFHATLQRFAAISLELQDPAHHNRKRKCDACDLKEYCDYRL